MNRFLFILIPVLSGLGTALLVLWSVPSMPLLPTMPAQISWAQAVEHSAPAVVSIYTSQLIAETAPFGPTHLYRKSGLGSGVVVDKNGYILTNHHVIAGADDILILADGRPPVPARIIGTDKDTDLALIQAGGQKLPVAILGNSDQIKVGDIALAIGNPFGVGKTVTQGIISAIDRQSLGLANYEDFIQTDAAINQGNSGGALINARGEVIGINTAILSNTGGSHGIGFAIPINLAKQVMHSIIRYGRVIRGWIGVSTQNIDPTLKQRLPLSSHQPGVLVTAVFKDGPADRAGIQPGDILLALNGHSVKDTFQISRWISAVKPGTPIQITVDRAGFILHFKLKVIEKPI